MSYEYVRNITVNVAVVASVAAAQMYRFVGWETSTPDPYEVKTYVPGANGGVPAGICAMKPDTNIKDGYVSIPMALADGAQCEIELGQAVTQGAKLRCGGNSSEVDGTAYLADAAGDVIIGTALKAGGVGEIIPFQFQYEGVVPA